MPDMQAVLTTVALAAGLNSLFKLSQSILEKHLGKIQTNHSLADLKPNVRGSLGSCGNGTLK